ncbi:MAG: hypothetical protein MRY77_10095 [Rhodobacteraceae bacterium]|nr:hypothetical protein [Paracoccaceae bacterium]
MSRVLVKFTTGYGRYNKNETAGFDAGTAKKLTEGPKAVGKIVGKAQEPNPVSVVTDLRQQTGAGADTDVKLKEALAELDRREAELDQRSADLGQRETEVKAREDALAVAASKEPEKETGAPPKQGAKS